MSTVVRNPLPPTRRAQMVLESTAATVALVLLGWLLLWFVWKAPRSVDLTPVFLPHDLVGYQAPDATALGTGPSEGGIDGIKATIMGMVDTAGQAKVVYLSLPVMGREGSANGEALLDLVTSVAGAAKRDVLLVVDASQIDSERELNVYGSAAYRALDPEALRKVDTKQNVYLLCSGAPGQKSWMMDGLGRSAFGYWFERGIAGDPADGEAARPGARGWDPSQPGQLTISGLALYVSQNVTDWVKAHRQAVQTPTLLAVGAGPNPHQTLRALKRPRSEPKVEATAKAETKGGAAATAKGDAAAEKKEPVAPRAETDPWKELLGRLMEEWREHDQLRDDPARDPVRWAPASWRVYEQSLLRAERITRGARHDEVARQRGGDAVATATGNRQELERQVAEAQGWERRFPIRPATREDGGNIVDAAARAVTGQGLPELVLKAKTPAPAEAAAPAPAAPGGGVVPGAATVRPLELLAAKKNGRPETYVELQVLAWADLFNDTFGTQRFRDADGDGSLLLGLVRSRGPAEASLALDRRGSERITASIAAGDAKRRMVQDRLFAAPDSDPEQINRLAKELEGCAQDYLDAQGKIGDFHRARALLEQMAAELPYYGEWLVLSKSRSVTTLGQAGDGKQFPAEIRTALEAAAGLIRSLEEATDSAALPDAVQTAERAMEQLRSAHDNRVRQAVQQGRTGANWREVDALLRVPRIASGNRARLVQLTTELDAARPEAQDRPADGETLRVGLWGPIDPGFAYRAVGLAELRSWLRRLALGGRAEEESGQVQMARWISDIRSNVGRKGQDDKVLEWLADLTTNDRPGSGELDRLEAAGGTAVDTKTLNPARTAAARLADRVVRFHADEVQMSEARQRDNGGPHRLEQDGRAHALAFQFGRLVEDYAGTLEQLESDIRDYLDGLDVANLSPGGTIRATVDRREVRVDPNTEEARFQVGLEVAQGKSVPAGLAFVGAVPEKKATPAAGAAAPGAAAPGAATAPEPVRLDLAVQSGPEATSNQPPGGLIPVGPDAGTGQIAYVVRQRGNATGNEVQRFLVAPFYRGRVGVQGAEPGTLQVAVTAVQLGDPITVVISHDKNELARRYGANAPLIGDVFARNGGDGYFHEGENLPYAIELQDRKRQFTEVIVEQSLVPTIPGGAPKPLPSPPRVAIKDGVGRLTGLLDAVQVPIGQPMKLVVTVKSPDGQVLSRLREATITQLALTDYISITEGRANREAPNRGIVPSLVVNAQRLGSDPATEPILIQDTEFRVNDRIQENPPTEGNSKDWLQPGQSLDGIQPLNPGVREYKWRWKIGKAKTMLSDTWKLN